MKILWVCNSPVKRYYEFKGTKMEGASWIDGLLENFPINSEVELGVCFPLSITNEVELLNDGNIQYYVVPLKKNYYNLEQYYVQMYTQIIRHYSPDIIHIWGTEFPYVLYMVMAAVECGVRERVVISLQGMCSAIQKHYYANIPEQIVKGYTFRDFVKRDNLVKQKKNYQLRAKYEKDAIQTVHYVIGRTDYDHAYARMINPQVTYFHCNEILRPIFYEKRWRYDNCEKHTLFVSQAFYPLKGCHFVLEAMHSVKKIYDDVHLYIAGPDILRKNNGISGKIKKSTYGRYLSKLIKKYNLENNVTFLGSLTQEEMCEWYLRCNVFVSASATENESNSLSEAKMLGMPVIASLVGGISNRITHRQDGLTYQYDDTQILAYHICELFENEELAIKLGENAVNKAHFINDKKQNVKRQLEIYRAIYERQ